MRVYAVAVSGTVGGVMRWPIRLSTIVQRPFPAEKTLKSEETKGQEKVKKWSSIEGGLRGKGKR
jgi:hypothetical protein